MSQPHNLSLLCGRQGGGILDPKAQLNIAEIAGAGGMETITNAMGNNGKVKKSKKEKDEKKDDTPKETKEASYTKMELNSSLSLQWSVSNSFKSFFGCSGRWSQRQRWLKPVLCLQKSSRMSTTAGD